jgi:hypothetical protein
MAEKNEIKISVASLGLNLDSQISQVKQGQLTHAMNAVISNFDGNKVTYQNELANTHCYDIPVGYYIIGKHNIFERDTVILFLTNPETGQSEIGKVINCTYTSIINANCLNFHRDFPILKVVHKVTNCGIEIYWTDNRNQRRWLDLENLPYLENIEGCDSQTSTEIDCNKLNIQPNFSIPDISYKEIQDTGELTSGTYQFAIQYSNALGDGYTSYYSVTNPISIFDPNIITPDYNYNTSKAIGLLISNIDTSGIYDYYNLAVIKTVNNIPSVELVDTFLIRGSQEEIVYNGSSKTNIRLSIDDIFAKFPYYEKAGDVTTISDIIVWSDLTTVRRRSYQKIANKIKLIWQSFKLPKDAYKDPLYTGKYKGYFRDEVYSFEFVPILKGGYQADRFHIPNRSALASDIEMIANTDTLDETVNGICETDGQPQPRWKVYNTAIKTEDIEVIINKLGTQIVNDPCYIGKYEAGEFAYHESTELYPCDADVWEDLAGLPIRYHRFPDSSISHIHDNEGAIFPLGVRISASQVMEIIRNSDLSQEEKDNIIGFKIVRGNRANNKSIIARGLISNVGTYEKDEETYFFPNYVANDVRPDPFITVQQTLNDSGVNSERRLNAFTNDDNKKRFTLHSPDTSFYQPYLGSVLKLETVEYGISKGEFVEVKEHAGYKTLSGASYAIAIAVGVALGLASTGVSGYGGGAAVAGFTLTLDIIEKLIPTKNYAYQFNSLNQYSSYLPVPSDGNKQRRVDLGVYLTPGMRGIGDTYIINNYQRESSVYLRTVGILPYVHEVIGAPQDTTKWIPDDTGCKYNGQAVCSTYYATLKKFNPSQYGSLYSTEVIDTGYQQNIDNLNDELVIFGGDCFINRFAYKSKLPFFIDNRVGFPNESDVFYDLLGNVAYPTFWMSTDVVVGQQDDQGQGFINKLREVLGIRANNFSCPTNPFFYQNGKFYLFAYGIQYFYCESEINVDARQAYNDREGDFFPRVSSDIPNDWLQEKTVSIINDNTYTYNKTFSKQNKENFFSYLPENYADDNCVQYYPNRAIFSERQGEGQNNWLIYRPSAVFNFPLNYGRLTSIDGIENKVVLVRFENKSMMYNALLTTATSAGQVFLGQSIFDRDVPPLDFAETDFGYVGAQHKFLLKTEYGHITVDSKRGQIFLLNGQKAIDITKDTASQFFIDNLTFKIKEDFPEVNIDNHFKGIGLHGIYDSRYNRVIITKLDYKLLDKEVQYINNKFYKNGKEVSLKNTDYFEDHTFTVSFSFDIQNWTSFHSYKPILYIGNVNTFYTSEGNSVWEHNVENTKFGNFYGQKSPYVIEYPLSFNIQDELLTHISDYTKVLKYNPDKTFIQTDDVYFNESVVYNDQQCATLKLVKKPKNSLSQYMTYPKSTDTDRTVTYSKVDSQYIYNDIIDMVKDKTKSFHIVKPDSIFKQIDESNIVYQVKSFNKSPLIAKDCKVRHTVNNNDEHKFISVFIATSSKASIL